jgi:hypothetical protein
MRHDLQLLIFHLYLYPPKKSSFNFKETLNKSNKLNMIVIYNFKIFISNYTNPKRIHTQKKFLQANTKTIAMN